MSLVGPTLGEGIARVRGAVRYVVLGWLANLALAVPLAAALFVSLRDDLGHQIAAERLRLHWDDHWHRAFEAQAQGLEKSFDAGIVGMGAVLRALDAQVTARLWDLPGPVLLAGLAYAAVTVFLAGGLLALFVHDEAHGATFWRGATGSFARLAKLALLFVPAYWLVLGPLHGALHGLVETATRDGIDERVHLAWVLGKYATVWAGVWALSLCHDYAKVILVAEPAASIPGAIARALALMLARPGPVFALSAAVTGIGIVLLLAYWVVAPGAGQHNAFLLLVAFVLSQLSVLARVAVRALHFATQAGLAGRLGAISGNAPG